MSKAPAVDYAMQIIELFSIKGCPLGITDISLALNINKTAVSRVLSALLEYGWIYCCELQTKKYALTLKPFSQVSKCVNSSTLIKTAEPFLKTLHDKLGDSVYLGVKHGSKVLYLLHYDSIKLVRINGCVGGEYPLHTTAPGKILLAWSDEAEINEYFSAEKPELKSAFISESRHIQEMGYALDSEDFAPGIICFAAPVLESSGNIQAAVGVSTLTIFDTMDSLTNEKGPLVIECARGISEALGFSKWNYPPIKQTLL